MPAQSRFTAENRKAVLSALEMGASRRTAAAMARIGEATLRRWLKEGENGKAGSQKARFYEDALEAEARPNVRMLNVVHQAALDNPMLAWKWVERREPGFAPPMPNQAPAPTQQIVVLTLDDGRSATPALRTVPNELNEPDEATRAG